MKPFMVTFAVGTVPVIAVEVAPMIRRLAVRVAFWKASIVAIARVEVVVYRAVEAALSVEPRSSPEEGAVCEPLLPVIPVGRAVIGSVPVVPIRTSRRRPNIYPKAYLRLGSLRGRREQHGRSGSQQD